MPAAKSIRTLRTKLDVSQKELAELVGVHAMTVSKWERGVARPSAHQARILEALASAGAKGLKASATSKGKKRDPVRFLSAALSHAYGGPELELGTLSATNRFPGRIVEIARGDVMSKVVIEVTDEVRIGAVITTDSVDRMRLQIGARAVAIIKATEVIVGGA
jgi:molybdopterin-binding protein